MTATAAEALELALWLHRAPARRAAVLARPLPEGVGQLLRVAGGAPDQVAAAALITGESEATILEAVRFYLQQILFHEDADAWRVLGLRPGATQAQAREHHRLLQHWLHPDRRGPDDWEAVYATRVNRAWTEIRTGRAHDQGRSRFSGEPKAAISVGTHRSGEYAIPVGLLPPRRSRTKLATLIVLLACIGLLVAIALRNDQPPEWRDPRELLVSEATPPPEPATAADSEVPDGAALLATLDALALEAARHAEAAGTAVATPVAAAVMEPVSALTATVVAAPQLPAAPAPAPRNPAMAIAMALVPEPAVVPEPPPAPPTAPPQPEAILMAAAETATIKSLPALPATPQPASIPNPLERMTQARARAGQVSRYLGDLGATAPPVWNDLQTLHRAQTLRAELHQRLGMPQRVPLEFRDPNWRLNADGAWLDTGYEAAGEEGRLKIAFTWREDQLLVRSLDLDPDA